MTATLVPPPGWLDDATGRVTGAAVTHSDLTGLWRLDLMPTAGYEASAAYRVVETCTGAVWHVHVPEPSDPDQEWWLRDVLLEPPDPSPGPWPVVRRLQDLADVDSASLAEALPGDRLTLLSSGKWGTEHPGTDVPAQHWASATSTETAPGPGPGDENPPETGPAWPAFDEEAQPGREDHHA